MPEPEQHEMQLEATHSSGAEEWYCPTCGRRFLVQWAPAYSMIILEPGDQYAQHSGSTGGLRIGSPQIDQDNEAPLVDDPSLAPWLAWLDEVDFESLWNSEV
jgi:hypothetical protein